MYIEFYCLSEHKFLSRREDLLVCKSYSHGMEKVWYPVPSISWELQKAYYHPRKPRRMLWLEQAKRAAYCDYNDDKCNMPRNKSPPMHWSQGAKYKHNFTKTVPKLFCSYCKEWTLKDQTWTLNSAFTIHSSHNKHPVNSTSACKGVSAVLSLWVD